MTSDDYCPQCNNYIGNEKTTMKKYRIELAFSMIVESDNLAQAEQKALDKAKSLIFDEYEVFVDNSERVDENYKPIEDN